jgi:hypothetical protein
VTPASGAAESEVASGLCDPYCRRADQTHAAMGLHRWTTVSAGWILRRMRRRILLLSVLILGLAGCGWQPFSSGHRADRPPRVDGSHDSTAGLVRYLEEHGYTHVSCGRKTGWHEVDCDMRDGGDVSVSYGFPFGKGCYTEIGSNEMYCGPFPEATTSQTG